MPIDEAWTVRPPAGSKRLTGAEILEAADRLRQRYGPLAATAADIKVITSWGGRVRYMEISVPELAGEDQAALDGEVFPPGQALPSADGAPTEAWFTDRG